MYLKIDSLILLNTLKKVKERVKNECFSLNMRAKRTVHIKCKDEGIIFRV